MSEHRDDHSAFDRGDAGATTVRTPGRDRPPELPGYTASLLLSFDPAPAYIEGIDRGDAASLTRTLHPSEVEVQSYLDSDDRLLGKLRTHSYRGPGWELFKEPLVEYGQSTCIRWIGSGAMHRLCRMRHRPVGPLPPDCAVPDVQWLATKAAIEGAVLFRRVVLVGGRWSVGLGATLTGLYLDACIHAYPTNLRAWHLRSLEPAWPGACGDAGQARQPSRRLPTGMDVEVDEATFVELAMATEGYSADAIATVLGHAGNLATGLSTIVGQSLTGGHRPVEETP